MTKKYIVQEKFDEFNSQHYLREYYSGVGLENKEILKFLHQAYAIIFSDLDAAKFLELGGGPTIYQLISAAKYPVMIHFSEHLTQNLSEVSFWMENQPKKYSWRQFIKHVLDLENGTSDENDIEERESLIRQKTKKLLHCDLRQGNPLGQDFEDFYDIVSMNFVAESITSDLEEWKLVLKNALSLVKNNGYLVMSVIEGARRYRVGTKNFPAAPVNRDAVLKELKHLNFEVKLEHDVGAEQKEEQGYVGIRMFLAKKIDN